MKYLKNMSLLGLLLFVSCTVSAAGRMRIVTEEYPPFNMADSSGKVVGVATDIVKALMAQAKLDYSIELLPWQRAISMARDLHDVCVYSMSRTVEREASYQWIGPLVENEWSLFARASDLQPPKTLDDLRGKRVGSYSGDAIVRYLQDRQIEVDVATTDNSNPRKLLIGRIDYWGTGKLIGQHILKQENIAGIVPVLTFNRTQMYLACNRATDQRLVNRLNQSLQTLDKNGSIERIYAAHGYHR